VDNVLDSVSAVFTNIGTYGQEISKIRLVWKAARVVTNTVIAEATYRLLVI
jgi:hypothetical protein